MRECRHDLGRTIWPPSTHRNVLARLGRGHYPPSGVTGQGWDCVSGWAGPDLSPLVVHRHTDDLSDVRRWLLRRAETEMVQDPADRDGVPCALFAFVLDWRLGPVRDGRTARLRSAFGPCRGSAEVREQPAASPRVARRTSCE